MSSAGGLASILGAIRLMVRPFGRAVLPGGLVVAGDVPDQVDVDTVADPLEHIDEGAAPVVSSSVLRSVAWHDVLCRSK
jgi:hypothetical protein